MIQNEARTQLGHVKTPGLVEPVKTAAIEQIEAWTDEWCLGRLVQAGTNDRSQLVLMTRALTFRPRLCTRYALRLTPHQPTDRDQGVEGRRRGGSSRRGPPTGSKLNTILLAQHVRSGEIHHPYGLSNGSLGCDCLSQGE